MEDRQLINRYPSTGRYHFGAILEPTLNPSEIRHLAEVLALFYDDMAEHFADGIAGASLGIRAPVQVFGGQAIEIPQRLAADGIVVRHTISDVEPWEVGNLFRGVAESVIFFGQPQLLVPGISLPYLGGALREVMNPAVLDTCHVPYHKIDVVSVSTGLESSLFRGETIQSFV